MVHTAAKCRYMVVLVIKSLFPMRRLRPLNIAKWNVIIDQSITSACTDMRTFAPSPRGDMDTDAA